jgi:hypothetical protein
MTNRLTVWPAALAMALVLGAPRSADACFDEHVSQVGPVRITVNAGESGGRLSCGAGATTCATWAARLARLLPGGARLEIRSGYDVTQTGDNDVEIELCLPRRRCRVTVSDTNEIGEIFDRIAVRLGTGRARRARIRRSDVGYFTLQAGAFARVEAAEALARRIDDETGGLGVDVMLAHPGPTHAAWVEEATLRGGGRVHRVMAGTFAGRASAVRAMARVTALTGALPLVRFIR